MVKLQMAPVVELPVDGLAYHGFTTILYDILNSLGVPIEKIEYVCRDEPGPNGFKGHIVVHLKVPASEFVLVLHAFETLEVENSIATCVQSVSHTALHSVMRDAHDYLKTGPYRQLPAALTSIGSWSCRSLLQTMLHVMRLTHV
jgi:hypothetical protein